MTITITGSHPTTVEASGSTTTTSPANALQDINDSIVGIIDSGATVDGFGLAIESSQGTLNPGSTIQVTNNGSVSTNQNSNAALTIGAAGPVVPPGTFGDFSYTGSGNITDTGTGAEALSISDPTGNVTVTVSATSTIAGSTTGAGIEASSGVNSSSTGTVTVTVLAAGANKGLVKGETAVAFGNGVATLNNSGILQGTGSLSSGVGGIAGTVTNSGTISGDTNGVGIENLTLTNQTGALIETTGTTMADSLLAAIVAVESLNAADITNQSGATIAATGQFGQIGVLVGQAGDTGNATLHNAGTISGALDGVNTNTSGTTSITNTGTISIASTASITTRSAVRVNTATIENDQNAVISGGIGIFFRAGNAASTVSNDGTITGTLATPTAIQFSTGSSGNTLTLGTDSVINGNVVGAGSDILQLGGTGSASFNESNIGAAAQYRGFTTFNKIGTSTWTLTGAGTNGWTVEQGTLQVDGTIGDTTVQSGATLDGTGTTGALTVQSGGTLAPGDAPGTIATGNLNLASGSTLSLEAEGVSAGAGGFDQVDVTGTVTLGGTLSFALLNGFIPSIGQTFDIIKGASALTGTFTGLGQGGTFSQDGVTYSISYTGGSGHDVVLTVGNAPDDTAVTFSGLTGGNAVQGTLVTVTSVTDGGQPVTNITYQWQRDGVDITNATAATYMPTENDEGHALTVNVGFTDINSDVETGTGSAGTVAEIAGGDTVVTLSGLTAGHAVQGTAVTVTGVTDGSQAVSGITYQWQRDGVNINTATNATYMPTEADEGHVLTVNVGFTDVANNAETGSASAGTVADSADEVVTLSGLSGGNAVQGIAVTVTGVTDNGAAVSGTTFTWKVAGSQVGTNSNTYTPVEADEGKALTVDVSFTDAASNVETATGNGGTVVDSADEVVTLSGLTGGHAVQGTAVTVTGVTDNGVAATNVTYQWQRDGVNINTATNAAYTPTENDEGHALTVNVGFTDANSVSETATASAGTVAETGGGDTAVALSGLTGGNAVEGTAVTATVTDGGLAVSGVTYTWKVAGVQVGINSNSYTPVDADESKALTLDVSFTDSAGNAETGSASGGTVQENPTESAAISISGLAGGNAVEGTMLTATVTDADAPAATAINFTWKVNGATVHTGLGTAGNTYTPVEGDEGKSISVSASFTDTHGNAGETGTQSAGTVQENPAENASIAISGLTGGNAVEGTQLTATVTEADAPAMGITYTWKVNGATVHTGVDSAGNTYTPVANDSGEPISVAVSFNDTHGFAETGSMSAGTVQGPNPPPPAGTTADMITVRGFDGTYEIYDIGHNAVLAAHPLTQIAAPLHAVGLGGFNGSDTTDMMLRNSSNGLFEVVDVNNNIAAAPVALGAVGLDWAVAGFGDFSSHAGETDMMLRNSNSGQFTVYDISNNAVTATHSIGAVGLDWSVAGFADLSGNANETDMMLRNSNTGEFKIYDISNNAVTGTHSIGAVGLDWSVAGFGDFSGIAGENDMLLRNSNSGQFEIYDISNNAVTGTHLIGAVGLDWTVQGFGNLSGNANETDMMMRNVNSGQYVIYDITNNAVTGTHSIGSTGPEWATVGIAKDPPTAVAPSSGALVASDGDSATGAAADGWLTQQSGIDSWLAQAMQTGSTANEPGFDAGGDPIAGTAPVTSLAMPNLLQTHAA